MLTAIVAVLGTLAGSLLTGVLQHFSQRAQRAAAEATARRNEGLAAVSELATALADHRRATMWVREQLRLHHEDWSEARAASHATRSAVTAPLLRVSVLLPTLARTAQTAAHAAYGMRAADSETGLCAAREYAIRTADQLVEQAGAALAA